jgi:hypothetical protein
MTKVKIIIKNKNKKIHEYRPSRPPFPIKVAIGML